MTYPFVAVLRRYVVDYTNAHDTSVIPEILDRGYRFAMGGTTIGYDEYVTMVDGAFDHFPDLILTVHDLFTNGERLAMWFSEAASAPRRGGNRASWEGVALYRWDGEGLLTQCLVEQDFLGRRRQLASGIPEIADPAMDDPWSIGPVAADPETEQLAVRQLAHVRPEHLDSGTPTIDDLFSAGPRVGFRLRWDGVYTGGLEDVPEDRLGRDAWIHATGVARIERGELTGLRMVEDRYGLRGRLRV